MKILQVGADLFHEDDGRTDMMKLIVSSQFCERAKKGDPIPVILFGHILSNLLYLYHLLPPIRVMPGRILLSLRI
jgi:hypothetical protein